MSRKDVVVASYVCASSIVWLLVYETRSLFNSSGMSILSGTTGANEALKDTAWNGVIDCNVMSVGYQTLQLAML